MAKKGVIAALTGALVFCLAVGIVQAQDPISIGSPLPMTGPYASDGEQMKMALELAVAEKNEAGGLLGRKIEIKFGDVGGLEAEKIKAVGERLLGSGVDAIITGYDDGGVDTKVFGASDVPYLHGNAMTLCTQPVAENKAEYWNVFQCTYNDKSYGVDADKRLFTEVPQGMGWTEPNKKIAIIKVDYAYNIMPADEFAKLAEAKGYKVVVNETVPFGVAEWGPILSKIESEKPAYVTFWHLDPTDASRFITQFSERFGEDGYDGVVYMQYTPSIPEFLELAGDAANGLIWVGGKYGFGPQFEEYKKTVQGPVRQGAGRDVRRSDLRRFPDLGRGRRESRLRGLLQESGREHPRHRLQGAGRQLQVRSVRPVHLSERRRHAAGLESGPGRQARQDQPRDVQRGSVQETTLDEVKHDPSDRTRRQGLR